MKITSQLSRFVDLDGDGITELLVTGDNFFSLYYCERDGWSNIPQVIPAAEVPPVSFRDNHIRLVNMKGDGLQDLVRIDGGGAFSDCQ